MENSVFRDTIIIRLTGGHRGQLFRPIAGGHRPHHSVGAFRHWEATVNVIAFKTGSENIDFPAPLDPDTWILQENNSNEGQAEIVGERQADVKQNTYQRVAALVFRSTSENPYGANAERSKALLEQMRRGSRVRSYLHA